MVGRTLAHYRIEEKIGAGGMGIVYRALDLQLGRSVALKVVGEQVRFDETARARLLREARTASALNHPNICTIYEAGVSDDETYVAMELVEGRPLSAMVSGDGMPAEIVTRYGVQIADALSHAHERGVVHRDLKTSNVMITPEGRPKVLDFGLAKRVIEDAAEATRTAEPLTEAGTVAGTLSYMAPEVLRGEPADARSDLWAFGVMLYQAVTGTLPFRGATGFQISSAILRDSAAPLPPHVPPGLAAILQRLLAKQPGERYQRASEVRAALEAIQPGLALSGPVPVAGVSRRRWVWGTAAVAVLTTVAAGVGFLLRDRRQTSGGPRVSTGAPASKNSEANEDFERALLFFRMQNDQKRGRQMLERALQLDPHFAEARRWYGFSHVIWLNGGYSNDTGWLYKAEEELRQALRDDPNLASVHSALAAVYLQQGRKDLVPSEVEKALKSSPDDPEALIWLLNYHRLNGEDAAAVALAKRMLEREPLFFPARMNLGDILRVQGDTAGAIREQEKVLEQAPGNAFGVWYLSRAYLDAGELAKAHGILDRSTDPRNYLARVARALLFAVEGKRDEALRAMDEEVLKFAAASFTATLEAAEFYAVLGETSKALEWLEQAVRTGDDRADWFQRDPLLANLRKEPRFQQMVDSIAYRRKQRLEAGR